MCWLEPPSIHPKESCIGRERTGLSLKHSKRLPHMTIFHPLKGNTTEIPSQSPPNHRSEGRRDLQAISTTQENRCQRTRKHQHCPKFFPVRKGAQRPFR